MAPGNHKQEPGYKHSSIRIEAKRDQAELEEEIFDLIQTFEDLTLAEVVGVLELLKGRFICGLHDFLKEELEGGGHGHDA